MLAVRFFIYYDGSIGAFAGCGSASAQAFTVESLILWFTTPLHSDTALLLCELGERAVNTSKQKILRRQTSGVAHFTRRFQDLGRQILIAMEPPRGGIITDWESADYAGR